MPDVNPLPDHVEQSVSSIMQMHREHFAAISPLQRLIDTIIAFAGRPVSAALVIMLIVGWVASNSFGSAAFDPPPFNAMHISISILALIMTFLILTSQRREDVLNTHRDQLTLEISLLVEQKVAKAIALIEELRRDSPHLSNRSDAEAEAMAAPSDPMAVMAAIRGETQAAAKIDDKPAKDDTAR